MFLFFFFFSMNLASIGTLLFAVGLISSGLTFTDYELRVLLWINTWGETMAWVIRGGLMVVGAILFILGSSGEKTEEAPTGEE